MSEQTFSKPVCTTCALILSKIKPSYRHQEQEKIIKKKLMKLREGKIKESERKRDR